MYESYNESQSAFGSAFNQNFYRSNQNEIAVENNGTSQNYEKNEIISLNENIIELIKTTRNGLNALNKKLHKISKTSNAVNRIDNSNLLSTNDLAKTRSSESAISTEDVAQQNTPTQKEIIVEKRSIKHLEFSQKVPIVSLKKSSKIQNLLKQSLITSKISLQKSNGLGQPDTFIDDLNTIERANIKKNLRQKAANSFVGYFIDEESFSSCSDTENNFANNNGKPKERNKRNKSKSRKPNNSSKARVQVKNKSPNEFPNHVSNQPLNFETIFVETLILSDSSSESSRSDEKISSARITGKRTQKTNHVSQAKRKSHSNLKGKEKTPKLKAQDKRNLNKLSRTNKEIHIKNFKKFKLKKCRIRVKNLKLRITKKMKVSTNKGKKRRRRWSISDVAREHDRRLKICPKAGPSHRNYSKLKVRRGRPKRAKKNVI